MAWIELHQSLFTHRKTMAAADLLDIPEVYVVAHLAALWTWALDNAQDGIIEASPRVIARACQWPGQPAALIDGLTGAGFLRADEATPNRYVIHDWDDYAGKLMDRRESNAERQRRHREKKKAQSHGEDAPVPETFADDGVTGVTPPSRTNAHVTVTNALRNGATQPNPTQPNRTEPEGLTNTEAATVAREAAPDRKPAPPSALGADAPDPLAALTGKSYPIPQTVAEVRRREKVAEILVAWPDWGPRLAEELTRRDQSGGVGNEYAYAVPILTGWLDKGGPPPPPAHRSRGRASPARDGMTATERRIAEGQEENAAFIADLREQMATGKSVMDGHGKAVMGDVPLCLPPTKH